MPATLSVVARQLTANGKKQAGRASLPSRDAVAELLEMARPLLFPHLLAGEPEPVDETVDELLPSFRSALRRQLRRADPAQAEEICDRFIESLPALQALLQLDVQAAMDGDPALQSAEEAVLCYPGVTAVTCFRIAHELHRLGAPFLPRMISAHAQALTGIDIHPGAVIGRSFFIDHGIGVVIGGTAVIGNRVRLYHGVTLGARSFPTDGNGRVVKGKPRHPILQDDVVVYAGASILGRITIGRGSVIGGSVWVTRDVAPGTTVTQAQPRQTSFADGAGI